jgi:gamma-glutamyltranspeptidase / glutathione hydrolase
MKKSRESAAARTVATLLLSLSLLTGRDLSAQVVAGKAALSTAHPQATRAGLAVLQRGGSAADAAVAVAFALAVVHPQAGNLGGGGFALYYDNATHGVWTLDFRESAPRALTTQMLAQAPDTAGARALRGGVPSTVAGLDALHKKFGTRTWKELLAPAIALAASGELKDAELDADRATAKSERSLEIPAELPPTALATTLQRLSEGGARDFYHGDLATRIVRDVRDAGGVLGFRDLREYEPIWRAPLKMAYGPYDIYAPPPPSSGGIVIGTALNILSAYDVKELDKPANLHLLLEAQRRAAIDARRYVGDPLGARLPYRELLSPARAEQWRRTLQPGQPSPTTTLAEPGDVKQEGTSTTHFTIVDEQGNVASVTTSLGNPFGAGVMLPSVGFFLNESMSDFSTGVNGLAPGKRPSSSMTPLLVLREGRPFLAMGTRCGPAGPTTLLQVFLRVVVSGSSLADAVRAPRFHHGGMPDEVHYERGVAPIATVQALNTIGHAVAARTAIGDVHAILFSTRKLSAVADSRRGGAAGGY